MLLILSDKPQRQKVISNLLGHGTTPQPTGGPGQGDPIDLRSRNVHAKLNHTVHKAHTSHHGPKIS